MHHCLVRNCPNDVTAIFTVLIDQKIPACENHQDQIRKVCRKFDNEVNTLWENLIDQVRDLDKEAKP